MSLTNENGMVMPVGPMGSYGNGYNNGFGFGDGSFWIIILFLFALMGGWGNGFGNGGGNAMPYILNNDSNMQRGFDQQSVMTGINGINSAITSLAQGQCNGFAGVNATVNNGFANAEVANNARQIANMQQGFNMQTALGNQLDAITMAQQNCCCENRAAVADLKYTVANEAATSRAAGQANTQAILDKLCQLELDGVKENYENRISGMQNTIDALRTDLGNARSDASQTAQTARILADNAAQTVALEQYLNPVPVPAYPVQNPNCCSSWNNWNGCGNV